MFYFNLLLAFDQYFMMFFFRLPHPILCQACQAGNLEAVKIILEAGANPNHFDVVFFAFLTECF